MGSAGTRSPGVGRDAPWDLLPDQDAAGSRGGMRVLRLLYQSRINKMFARY